MKYMQAWETPVKNKRKRCPISETSHHFPSATTEKADCINKFTICRSYFQGVGENGFLKDRTHRGQLRLDIFVVNNYNINVGKKEV